VIGRRHVLAAMIAAVAGCAGAPQKVPCMEYVAGNFYDGNNFAMTVDDSGWPMLGAVPADIQLTFLLAGTGPQTVELVHVAESREVERWKLNIRALERDVPACTISSEPVFSNCGATLRVLPQKAGGYYYLRGGPAVIEAGMTFLLCDPTRSAGQ